MGVLLSVCWFGRVLDRLMPSGNPALDQGAATKKARTMRAFAALLKREISA
jgi:hypothetical protein